VDIVKGADEGIKDTIKGTINVAKSAVKDVPTSGSQSVNKPNNQTTYILVPVDKQD
jgi:hypothetical protein